MFGRTSVFDSDAALALGIRSCATRPALGYDKDVQSLFVTIRRLVLSGRYIVGQHAAERLEERGVLEWQIVDGIGMGRCLAERKDAHPNAVVEVAQVLADGTGVVAVWSYIESADIAKLVTVYFHPR